MAPSARSILVGIANAVALFMVIGVIAHGYMDEAKPSTNVVSMVEHEADLPSVAGTARHLKSSKGGKGSAIECVDADATPAPTKGKGKGKKMSMKMSSKGKGSSSEAPSFFCSEAPSLAPSTSAAPSDEPTLAPSGSPSLSVAPSDEPTLAPSGSPSLSAAPTECGSSKGKGSCSMSGKSMMSKGKESKGLYHTCQGSASTKRIDWHLRLAVVDVRTQTHRIVRNLVEASAGRGRWNEFWTGRVVQKPKIASQASMPWKSILHQSTL
eukprot:scaffold20880_cov174-Amphora_coffeaeformis.AAC.2